MRNSLCIAVKYAVAVDISINIGLFKLSVIPYLVFRHTSLLVPYSMRYISVIAFLMLDLCMGLGTGIALFDVYTSQKKHSVMLIKLESIRVVGSCFV